MQPRLLAPLSSDDIGGFWRRGFVSLSYVVEQADLDEVQKLLDPLFLESPSVKPNELGPPGQRSIVEINGTSRWEPQLLQTRAFALCHSLAESLLGAPARFSGDHAIYKLPHSPHRTAWHQDQAYMGHSIPVTGISIWLPLQATPVEAGCMRFIEGSHRSGLYRHRKLNGHPEAHALEALAVNDAEEIVCPLPAGGATIHLPLTMHSTGPNQTNTHRRAWILGFSYRSGFQRRRLVQFGIRKIANAIRSLTPVRK